MKVLADGKGFAIYDDEGVLYLHVLRVGDVWSAYDAANGFPSPVLTEFVNLDHANAAAPFLIGILKSRDGEQGYAYRVQAKRDVSGPEFKDHLEITPRGDSWPVEVADLVDGLFAYDTGCVSSGIKDESARQQVKEFFRTFSEGDRNGWFCNFLIRHFLSLEARAQGYGIEDARAFLQWCEDQELA